MVAISKSFVRSISMTVILSIIFTALCPMAIFSASETIPTETITVTNAGFDGEVAIIEGSVSTGEKAYLKLDVKKDGVDFYTENFYTEANGTFSVDFDVDPVGNERQTYTYTIKENLPETVVTSIHTQNFQGTLPAYTANTGSVDSTLGNPAPSYQLGSAKRLLYSHSSAITSGSYTVETDLYFNDVPTSNGNIFMTTNAAGSSADADNGANAHYAYIIDINSGDLRIRYSDTNVKANQTATNKYAVIVSDVAKETWYKVKVCMNLDTYEMQVYLNGTRVLELTDLYIFAQKNYTRAFDTSSGTRPEVYIDNLKIDNVVEGSLLGIEDKAGSLIRYGITDYNNAIIAVNGANDETIIGVLDANKDIIGIDISKYYGFDDAGKDTVETGMTSSPDYNTLEDIRTAYNEVCSYVDIKAATGANLKDKLKMNASILNIELSDDFYDDADIIGCIYSNISYVSDFDTLKTLVLEGNDLFKLKNLDTSDLSSAKSFMAKYGYNVDYDACNDDIKNAIKTEADNFTLDYSKKPIENLKLWATAINAAYVNAKKINSDYVINVSEYKVTDNKIVISGSVEPKVKYNFVAVASQNGIEKGRALFSTDAEGKFSCTITLPVSRNDIEYTVKIEAIVPEEDPIYLFKEYFDGTETNSYTMSDGVNIVDNIGTPVPALKVSKETGEERARQLATVAEIASLTEGLLCIKADFMKPEKSASTIYRVADNNGSTNAITLASDNEGKVTLTYLDASNVLVIKDLILADDFEVNKWYSLSIKIDTQTNEAIITIDDVKYNFTLGISAINLTRAFDTIAAGTGIHYIDNVVIYQDKAERINSSVEVMNVLVYGTDAISATIEAVTSASPETMESVLLSNNHILKLDLTASSDFNNLADDSSVVSALANKQTFSGVNEICKIFYGETALQKMKESADNIVKATTLEKYSSYIGINKSDVLKNNPIYLSLLGSNINSANNMAELKVVSNKITLAASIMSATQFTIKGVIDNNITALVNLGLNGEYNSLTSDEKKTVSGAIFDVDLSETNINNLLGAIVQKVNDAITDLPNGDLPGGSGGGGGGSAGGRPAGAASGNASGDTIAIAPGNAETITPQLSKTFDDVSSGHWACEAIEYLASKGIVAGKGQRRFEPDVTVKREEFIKMIIVSLGVELKTGEGVFEDVPVDVWYSNYVNTAVDLGIVNGISEKHFGSGIDVSRQDAVTILYRCKDSLNSGLIDSREYHEFDDANEISGYAKKAVEYFYECNVINGINEQVFAPTKSLTRVEAAKMLYEIIRR